MRQVIINADDFGLSESINRSIITAYERGVLTSTTLLVDREATNDAVEIAKDYPRLSIGLHLDLDRFFCFEVNGYFGITIDDIDHTTYDYITRSQLSAIRQEIARQVETIFRLGICPTHLDGHHNIHLMPSILLEVVDVMRDFSLNKIRFPRNFYGSYIDIYRAFKNVLDTANILYPKRTAEIDEELPLGRVFERLDEGISEVIVHTDLPDRAENQWRVEQYEYISSPDAHELINRQNLMRTSYAELGPHNSRM
jgi:predicted glycoside hydrolase/deacetylase ChbG (UPF0249 family)